MSNSCNARYILQDCSCLTDPLDYYSNVCGYISKESGLLYQCDPGCCAGTCANTNPEIGRIENRPSAGLKLPAGFGVDMQQSDQPTQVPGAVDFPPPSTSGYKVWEILLIAFIPLLLALVMAFFLT